RPPGRREGRRAEEVRPAASAGVVLDDELLVADHRDLLAGRLAVQAERQGLEVHLQVARGLALGGEAALAGDLEERLVPAALTDLDDVVRTHTVGRLVDLLAVDLDVAVGDHLTGLVDRAGDARTQDQGVETALELDEERVTG